MNQDETVRELVDFILDTAILELKRWYTVRAELHGELMKFFVDDEFIGSVSDARSLSGAVGVAVEDAMEVLFDDFTVAGDAVTGNGLEIGRSSGEILPSWPSAMTNFVLGVKESLSPGTPWDLVTNSPAIDDKQNKLTLHITPGTRFYMLRPKIRTQ
jgi:hypothetical protein